MIKLKTLGSNQGNRQSIKKNIHFKALKWFKPQVPEIGTCCQTQTHVKMRELASNKRCETLSTWVKVIGLVSKNVMTRGVSDIFWHTFIIS